MLQGCMTLMRCHETGTAWLTCMVIVMHKSYNTANALKGSVASILALHYTLHV